jgi:hypothetical protein
VLLQRFSRQFIAFACEPSQAFPSQVESSFAYLFVSSCDAFSFTPVDEELLLLPGVERHIAIVLDMDPSKRIAESLDHDYSS